jgi:ABC-2 type transport system permease protein
MAATPAWATSSACRSCGPPGSRGFVYPLRRWAVLVSRTERSYNWPAGGVYPQMLLPTDSWTKAFSVDLQRLMDDVWLGTLDFILTKPEDAQLLVSVQEVQLWKLVDVALGLALLGVALLRLGAHLGFRQAGAFIIALLAGGAIVYSFLLVLATCSFWTIRAPNILAIFQSMYAAGRWPISIYPPWLRATLTVVVPVGFAVTVPAGALVGHQGWQGILGAVALAGALLVASRWFWTRGLRHYVGASA